MRSETESTGTSPAEARSGTRSVRIVLAIGGLAALVAFLVATGRAPERGPLSAPASTIRTLPDPDARFYWEGDGEPSALVDLDEIRSGGPPPDGIPPIDAPVFVPAAQAAEWLADREPVIALVRDDVARAYPLQIMTWHEIVNDEVGGQPLTITFCPLCNSAIGFERALEAPGDAARRLGSADVVLDFGTSGRLYRSNLVMYDRQTKSMWVQFTGQAIVGPFAGTQLAQIPLQIVSFADVRTAHPDVEVLSRETGHARDYGRNPYSGYDDIDASPFLFDGPEDDRLRPMTRVVTVAEGIDLLAVPLDTLRRQGSGGVAVAHVTVGGRGLVFLYADGTASALDDRSIASSRDVGATGVFDAAGAHFTARDGTIRDERTGSSWNVLGEATDGPLAGQRLAPIVHDDTFWFVWAAFRPNTRIWTP